MLEIRVGIGNANTTIFREADFKIMFFVIPERKSRLFMLN